MLSQRSSFHVKCKCLPWRGLFTTEVVRVYFWSAVACRHLRRPLTIFVKLSSGQMEARICEW